MKRILSILLLMATLLSAFSITAFADDNATAGEGTTHSASDGYGWYNTNQFLWKVTLYVGKSDQATKQSNLTNDFYRIGTVILKRPGWSVSSSCVFGNATKVDYYGGTSLSLVTNPYIMEESSCPKVPILCGGNVDTVKSYFGSTGTLSTLLNNIASHNGTTAYGMVKSKTFTIGGVTKSGWSSEYLLPSGTTNRVPWVIVYEPIVKMHLKDGVNTVAFTATEYVISAEYGWYDWYKSGGSGQNVSIVPYRHLPTSVQLEESWFGYPVYPTRNDSYKWSVEEVIKGGGWGMRWLPIGIQEPVDTGKDYSVRITAYDAAPKVGEKATITIRWENNKATSAKLLMDGNTVSSIDELYLFLSNLTAIEYIRNASKRVRKKNSAIILASQNIEDFLLSGIREYTKPLFSIPSHHFLFNPGNINPKEFMDALQLEETEYDLIKYPERGTCLFRCGNERYLLQVIAPEYKAALFEKAGGR